MRTLLKILGVESLGVRGFSCFISSESILLDPGIALGYTRYGLHPHPLQAMRGYFIRKEIINLWRISRIVVISHFHGDHVPLPNANPFQLSLQALGFSLNLEKIYVPSAKYLQGRSLRRFNAIKKLFGDKVVEIEGGYSEGILSFYGPVPHGLNRTVPVIATLTDAGSIRILHAPDIQLLPQKLVEIVLEIKPEVILTDGPPIYRYLSDLETVKELLSHAEKNLCKLCRVANKIIVDHHLLRCNEGYEWLKEQKKRFMKIGCEVCSAAEYMGQKPLLLEAWRKTLYEIMPFDNKWFTPEHKYKETLISCMRVYKLFMNELRKYSEEINEKAIACILNKIVNKSSDIVDPKQ